MKFLIVFISSLCLNLSSIDLDTVRNAYKEASHDKNKVAEFNNLLSSVTKKGDIVLVAYKGAAMTLKAKHSKVIKNKKKFFTEGVSYLEFAIEKAPTNIEARFIRIGVQENTPKFLKYKKNIDEDKQYILTQFSTIKSSLLKKHIHDYILQSKLFTDEEKSVISKS